MQRALTGWQDVQLFLGVARAPTLAVAAKALGVDTSTASRRLARLEEELGVRLFDRRREGLAPTPHALALLPAAEAMEAAAQRFSEGLAGFERSVEGTVRLSAPPGVAEGFVGPALPELRRRYPGLRLEVDASVRPRDLARREVDLAIRTLKPERGPLVQRTLTRARWVPMASPALAAALGTVKRWDDVPWIGWGFELAGLHAAQWLARRVTAPLALRTNSFPLQLAALKADLGAALAPEPYAAVHQLVPLAVARSLAADLAALPTDTLWLVAHEAVRPVPRVDAVWRFLADAFRA